MTYSATFCIRTNKPDKPGKCIIYFRVTIDGPRAKMSTHRKIEISLWNSRSGKAKSTKPVGKDMNLCLNKYRDYQKSDEEKLLLPVISNQKLNAYLKVQYQEETYFSFIKAYVYNLRTNFFIT